MNMKLIIRVLPAVVTSLCLTTISMAADVHATANRVMEGLASDEAKAAKLVEAAGQDDTGDASAAAWPRAAPSAGEPA